MKYAFMQTHRQEFRLASMCRVLAGEPEWLLCLAMPTAEHTRPGRPAIDRAECVLHQQTREAYGARRMWQLLIRDG